MRRGRSWGAGGGSGRGGAGRGAVFVLENPTAPRGGAAPPARARERGGPLDPLGDLGGPSTWDTPEPGNGRREGIWKERNHLRARGGTPESQEVEQS